MPGTATAGILAGIGAGMSGVGAIAGAIGNRRRGEEYSPDVNPYAEPAFGQMMGASNWARGQMDQYQLPDFLGNVNQFQDVMQNQGASFIDQIMGGTRQAAYDAADLQAQQNMRQVGGQYGNMGAVQSGAGLAAMAQGVAMPYSQAMRDITGMRAQATQGVGSQLWGGLQNINQLGMQQYQTQAGIYGQALGGMGQLGSLAAQPQTTYAPGSMYGSGFAGLGGALMTYGQSFGDDDTLQNRPISPMSDEDREWLRRNEELISGL